MKSKTKKSESKSFNTGAVKVVPGMRIVDGLGPDETHGIVIVTAPNGVAYRPIEKNGETLPDGPVYFVDWEMITICPQRPEPMPHPRTFYGEGIYAKAQAVSSLYRIANWYGRQNLLAAMKEAVEVLEHTPKDKSIT